MTYIRRYLYVKAYFLCLKWVVGIYSGYTIATLPNAYYIALNSKFDIDNSTFMVQNIINKNNSLSCQKVYYIFNMLRNFSWVIFCYKRISFTEISSKPKGGQKVFHERPDGRSRCFRLRKWWVEFHILHILRANIKSISRGVEFNVKQDFCRVEL